MIETLDSFIYFFIALTLIFLDKSITALTIKIVEKKHPTKDKFSIEKNPLALHFLVNYGLLMGSIFYGIVSLFTFFFTSWLFHFIIGWDISYLIMCLIYVVVIINNIRWYFKFKR